MDIFNAIYVNEKAQTVRRVHMIGINGISMSGLSELLIDMGYLVSGSDLTLSDRTNRLKELGVVVYNGHSKDNIKDADVVIYTAAVKSDNPELKGAMEAGIPCLERAELLGAIMSGFEKSIAVSGTHGKTTTTAMITQILITAGFDPTAHIGAEYKAIGGTTRIGQSDLFVTEACEYRESFLRLHPHIALILNIDLDHIDYFKNIQHLKEAFISFSRRVPENGFVIANADDKNCVSIFESLSADARKKWFFFGQKESSRGLGCVYAENLEFDSEYCGMFDVYIRNNLDRNNPDSTLPAKKSLNSLDNTHLNAPVRIRLNVPGVHNVYNALAAIAACIIAGCPVDSICCGLQAFCGTNKRFEHKGVVNGITIVDDYAHHPSEINYALATGRKLAGCSRLICVFQPHTYTRTRYFLNEFANALKAADIVVLADIFAAREADPGDVSSEILATAINEIGGNAIYIKDGFDKIAEYILVNGTSGDLVITMGAGNAVKVANILLSHEAP